MGASDSNSISSFSRYELANIEVNEAMLEVGLRAFTSYDKRFDLPEEAVVAIYRRMENARRLSQEEKSPGQAPGR